MSVLSSMMRAQRSVVRAASSSSSAVLPRSFVRSNSTMADDAKYILRTYARQPIELVKGEGVWVWDANGKNGIAVNSLGHSHPGWVSAVSSQAGSLTHVSNLFYSRPQTQLAKQLIELSGGRFDKVFFCNSGTEANEAALKFARKYQMEQYRKKTGAKQSTNGVNAERVHEKMKLIAFQGGFHGRTIGALSLTSKWPYRAPFAPLLADVSMLPFNDEAALSAINAETAAVFVEPVQGEGGVYPSRPSFLASIRSKCNSHDALMIVDEVQCGLSRTGAPFAHQHEAFDYVEPDMMTLAKPLAGGLPIGAVLLKNKVAEAMQPGDHGSTFSGGPLVCTAAGVAVAELSSAKITSNVAARSKQLIDGLNKIKDELNAQGAKIRVSDVRGLGLLVGFELSCPAKDVIAAANESGLMLIGAGDNVIRLCPPLIVEAEHIDFALNGLRNAIQTAAAKMQ